MYISSISYNYNKYSDVSFKAKPPVRIGTLKALRGVTCIYCGEKMLTYNQVKDYAIKASKYNGKKLYEALASFERFLKPNEKAVLKIIKEEIKKNPKSNIQNILQNLFPRHVGKLEKKQKDILNQIAKISKSFPEDDRNLTMMQVYKGLYHIKNHVNGKHFKLNVYLSDFYKNKSLYKNEANFDKIDKIIRSMPNSHTNIDAFIVKYSRKPPREIIERLLRPSQLTIEHLKPRSLGGTNDMFNIVLACGNDNSKRSSKPLDAMPQLRKNVNSYFMTLRFALGKKLPIQDCLKVEEYINSIKKTINSMLSQPIKFDTSKGSAR